MARKWLWPIVALLTLAVDQITKAWLFKASDPASGAFAFSKIIQLTRYENHGIALSLPLPTLLTLVLTGLFIAAIVYVGLKKSPTDKILAIALGLLVGGALGNFVDRLWLGFVRDWLLLFERSAINFADIAVLVGIAFLLFFSSSPKASTESD